MNRHTRAQPRQSKAHKEKAKYPQARESTTKPLDTIDYPTIHPIRESTTTIGGKGLQFNTKPRINKEL